MGAHPGACSQGSSAAWYMKAGLLLVGLAAGVVKLRRRAEAREHGYTLV